MGHMAHQVRPRYTQARIRPTTVVVNIIESKRNDKWVSQTGAPNVISWGNRIGIGTTIKNLGISAKYPIVKVQSNVLFFKVIFLMQSYSFIFNLMSTHVCDKWAKSHATII
jgi:hypothetical protein